MLEFPKEYFQDEEIEGFLVDKTMKTVWAAELEVLNEIAIICSKYNLRWFAAYGTLLGAARHGGFIPWDDDIDIWMMREDYHKLMKVLTEELPDGYEIRSPHAREGYPEYQVYINNCEHVRIDMEHLQKFHGCPFSVGIDIYPLDVIPKDPKRCDLQKGLFSAALTLQRLEYDINLKIQDNKEVVEESKLASNVLLQVSTLADVLHKEYCIGLDKDLLIENYGEELLKSLWSAAEQLSNADTGTDGAQIAMYLDYLKFGKVYEKSWFNEVDYLSFEGFDIPVPKEYDAVLKRIYGDYSVRVRNGALHDYPCYRGQIEELRRRLEEINLT